MMIIDMTAQLSPLVVGLLAVLVVAAAGLAMSAWRLANESALSPSRPVRRLAAVTPPIPVKRAIAKAA
jgi:hypothetical protein